VLVGKTVEKAPVTPLSREWQRATAVFAALGLAISVVAGVDLAMAWFPAQFGNAEWEFGIVTRTFDSLALGTTGFGLLVLVALVRRLRLGLAVVGVLAVLGSIALAICLVLYGLNVPVALGAVPEAAGTVLRRAMVRTGTFGVIYLVLYVWLSWYTWRGFRAEARGGLK